MQKTGDFSYNVHTRNKQEPCFDQSGGKPAQDTKFRGRLDYLAVRPSPDITIPHEYGKLSSAICFANSCDLFGNRGRALVSSSTGVFIVWRLFCSCTPALYGIL